MANTGERDHLFEITRVSSQHGTVPLQDPFLSDEAGRVLEIIFSAAIGILIGVVGSALNVINIIVFVKQGFSDSMSISLCALAASDLGFLLLLILTGISCNPLIQYADTPVDIADISYIAWGTLVLCFVRVTGLITAFITFERCVCIALPLKVKTIITPKRTLISIIAMYVIIFATNVWNFFYVNLAPSFNSKSNKTLISLIYKSTSFYHSSNSFNTSVQISSFIIVIFCTAILNLKLISKSNWRRKAISVSNVTNSMSMRDKRVMKMVTLISSIFIVCYLPEVINLIISASNLAPEYSAIGSYKNSYRLSWAIIDSLDGINSSVSILIYYNMSSRFRKYFNGFFHRATKFHRDINASLKS